MRGCDVCAIINSLSWHMHEKYFIQVGTLFELKYFKLYLYEHDDYILNLSYSGY